MSEPHGSLVVALPVSKQRSCPGMPCTQGCWGKFHTRNISNARAHFSPRRRGCCYSCQGIFVLLGCCFAVYLTLSSVAGFLSHDYYCFFKYILLCALVKAQWLFFSLHACQLCILGIKGYLLGYSFSFCLSRSYTAPQMQHNFRNF